MPTSLADETRYQGIDWFGTPVPLENLKKRSVRGVLVNVGGGVGSQIIRITSLVFLARLLVPEDFGLIAMAMVFVGLAAQLNDAGLTAATIRFPQLNHAQSSNMYWVTFALSAVLTCLILLIAPYLQAIYDDPRIHGVVIVLSVTFLLSACDSQHRALLRRALRFNELARITLWTAAITAVVSLWGACANWGYWALVAGVLSGGIVRVILAWDFCDWRPSRPALGQGTRPLIIFGLRVAILSVVGFVGANLHSLIIGSYWGANETGQFGRAIMLQVILITTIVEASTIVAPAAMTRLSNDPARLSNFYYKACALIMIAAMPIVFIEVVLPKEIVLVALGDQWALSAQLLPLLAIGILPQMISIAYGWVYYSIGNAVTMMWWGLANYGALIVATLIGALYGLKGIALASALTPLVLAIPGTLLAYRGTPLQFLQQCRTLSGPIFAGLIAAALCWPVVLWMPVANPLYRIAAGLGGFSAVYALLLMGVFKQGHLIIDTLAQLKTLPNSNNSPANENI